MSRAILGPKASQRFLRELVFFLLWLSGLPIILRWKNRNSPRILVYHGFYDENSTSSEPINVWVHQPISLLNRQLTHLSKYYQSVSTQEIETWLEAKKPIHPHAVAIHIDDGLESVFKLAAPCFLQHRWTFDLGLISGAYSSERNASWEVWIAAVAQQKFPLDAYGHYFLTQATRYIRADAKEAFKVESEAQKHLPSGCSPFEIATDMVRMSWPQIIALQKQGFGLMNHTCGHEVLNKLSDDEIEHNLKEANKTIAEKTGIICNNFVYPTGVVDTRIAQAVARAGFPFAYSLMNDMIKPSQNRQILPRIGIPSAQGYYEFVCRVAGVHAFFLSLKN